MPMACPNQVNASTGLIDDRSAGTLQSSHAGNWQLVTDQVMGGRSSGELVPDHYLGKSCLRMRGLVSTANNGGFLQLALDLDDGRRFDASIYDGLEIVVAGNNERYNIHLRTSNLWLPWQSYRASFAAGPQWRTIRISFSDVEAYRTSGRFLSDRLIRVGLVAIGRDFVADLCVGGLYFYHNDVAPGA
jgi:hypothetical protein